MPPTETVDQNGRAIRNLRQQRGYTVTAFAAKIGRTPGTISNIETGTRRCSTVLLAEIAEALDVDPAELVQDGPAQDSALLRIPEAARELGCSGMHVYRLIASGELRAVDIAAKGARASKLRVRRDDLTAFIDARTSAAGVAATA